MALRKKRIEIFRAGRHVASDGRTIQFSTADLDKMVENYDPGAHAAPLVVGHPKHDDPSYGRVQALARDGEKLVFDVEKVESLNPDFAEAVNAGAYDRVSASLYTPDAAGNPKPGAYYLRHVGFLGATPPAIRGLARAEFSDDGSGVVEFSDWSDKYVARALRGIRDWMISKFGQEEADKALPGWDMNYLQEETAADAAKDTTSYSEGAGPEVSPSPSSADGQAPPATATTEAASALTPPEPVATEKPDPGPTDRETELKKREEELAKREAAAAAREVEQRTQSHKDFCERLVREGRPLPVPVTQVVNFLCALDGDVVSFGETDTRTMSQRFREDYLAKLPVSVQFGELAPAEDDPTDGSDSVERRAKEIIDYQETQAKAGVVVTTSEAARATSKRSK